MSKERAKTLKEGIKKAEGIIFKQKTTFDKLLKQEPVTSDELDKLHEACIPGRDYKRRRALQDRYGFLKPTSLMEGLMAFGFECDDGWLPILEDLFGEIDKAVKKDGPGDFKVSQVKEKFGGLCVYVRGGNGKIHSLIREAERKAVAACEVCGQPGKNSAVNRWYKTTCEKHYRERLKRHNILWGDEEGF